MEPDLPAPAGILRRAEQLALGAGAEGLCLLENPRGLGSPTWAHLLWAPAAVFTVREGQAVVRRGSGATRPVSGDPFQAVQALLAEYPGAVAAGYWGYDLARGLERLPTLAEDDLRLPECWVGVYPGGLRRQRRGGPWVPFGEPPPWPGGAARPPSMTAPLGEPGLRCRVSQAEYEAAVRRVLEYIAAGDCYQVNLSRRLDAPLGGHPWQLYLAMRRSSPAPFAAYLDCGTHQVLSSSPELFLRVRRRHAETRPIKGTRPRGRTPEEDDALRAQLLSSPKDAAELLMIVDLERNDLGKVCEYGSVRVPRLRELESYRTVHHLVATVTGRLRAGVGPLEGLRALFPGGSITGAPKIRAMEIIEELEPVRRGVYTGGIGWVEGTGNGEWSIAIRTVTACAGRAWFHVGGGIVAESDPAAEYAETLAKAGGILRALGISSG
jgi:para-aminobenzoate synthetase component 1